MKKIYSFVLMAAMLLVGANVWAGTYNVGSASDFETAWAKSATEDVVINLTGNVALTKTMWLGTVNLNDAAHSVEINLGENKVLSTSAAYGFLLTHGALKISGNGTINASCAKNVFFITGSTNKNVDPRNDGANFFTHLEIGAGVTIQYSVYDAAISVDRFNSGDFVQIAQSGYVPSKPALTYATNVYTKPSTSYGVANGVRVDLYGQIIAQKYGIKTNGNLGSPTTEGQSFSNAALTPAGYTIAASDKDYAPFIYVHEGAYVHVLEASDQEKKPLALYASGYAHWKIEGTAEGNVGLMVKSGDVDINNATITSTAPSESVYVGPNNGTSGTSAVGSAIVINSADAYAGDIDVTISGTTTVTSEVGYAIDEKVVTAGNGTKVESLTIESGSFDGGNKIPDPENPGQYIEGTIVISEATSVAAASENVSTTQIVVTSATIEGPVTFGGTDPDDGQPISLTDFTNNSVVIEPTEPSSSETVVVPLTIKVVADGWASYSAPIDLYLTGGLKAYTGKLNANKDELGLTEVNYVKANEGVILYGSNFGGTYHLSNAQEDKPTTLDTYTENDLKPSSAWVANGNHDQIYCLRNVGGVTMFYQYVGAEMPANKAYLDLSEINSGAPQRIRMVIAQEEQTEAISNVEAASVKAVKFVENGEILIRRGENVYNLQGQIVK